MRPIVLTRTQLLSFAVRQSFSQTRRITTEATSNDVRIVEVSPRDGLQNEKGMIPTATKVELIKRLRRAGSKCIESGSFVSPKWVPQMKDTADVLRQMGTDATVDHPVLVPNMKGLDSLLDLLQGFSTGHSNLASADQSRWPTKEIALFTAASETFCKKNTNCSIKESLERLADVTQKAKDAGLLVRGYISVVAVCPYEGRVSAEIVGDIAKELLQMGCYEVSLGDTVGAATPTMMRNVLAACLQRTHGRFAGDANLYAAHCHDTMGTGLANVMALVQDGVRSVDSAVGGIGGCPYSPGATGNIDTESVVFALEKEGYRTGIQLEEAARIGQWVSDQLGKRNNSSAGRAILARLEREDKQAKL